MILINIRCFQRYRFQWTRKTFSPAGQIRSSVLTDVSKLIEILEESVEFGGNRGRNYSNYWKLEIESGRGARWSEEKGWRPSKIRSAPSTSSSRDSRLSSILYTCPASWHEIKDEIDLENFTFFFPPFLFSEIWQNLFSVRFVDSFDALKKKKIYKIHSFNSISIYDVDVVFLNY